MFKVILSRFLISDDLANIIALLGAHFPYHALYCLSKIAYSDSNLVLA